MIPVQHQHIQRRLAATVRYGFKIHFLGPSCWLGWSGKEFFACHCYLGEPGYKNEARVGGFEEEGDECVCHDVGAGEVDIVGFIERVAEGDFAAGEFTLECGS
jgi:hypothetical protein